MIKFFRKIRQRLLTENKFSKYLLYAIGEIILVVIGILIALQINTWNQERITLVKEQSYLKSLKNEFDKNLNILETSGAQNKTNRIAAIQIANIIDDVSKHPTSEELSLLLTQSFAEDVEFRPSSAVLNEMINTGSMKDISSDELKIHLASWESILGTLKSQERLLILDRVHAVNQMRANVSFRSIFDDTGVSTTYMELKEGKRELSVLPLLKSQDFENDLLLFITTNKSTEQAYEKVKNEILITLALLKKEIK